MIGMSNASLKFFTAPSTRITGRALFLAGMKVNTISFWLHLTNLTFDLVLSRISESERQAAIFSIDFLFWAG